MNFVNAGFLSEHLAEMHYYIVGLPEEKSLKDLKDDWFKVIKDKKPNVTSLPESISALAEMGYTFSIMNMVSFYEDWEYEKHQ